VLHAGQALAQLLQDLAAVYVLACVMHAVHGDQRLGRYLLEAVEHGMGAHVGRADAPDGAQAGAGQKGDDGLGNIGQIGRDAVALGDALGAQMQGQGRHLALQLGPAQLALQALLVAADDGRHAGGMGRLDMAQHLLHIVHLRAREPLRAGHGVAGQHRAVRRGRLQIEVIPDALPEGIEIAGRPAPQRVIVGEAQAARFTQPVLVQPDLGNIGGGVGGGKTWPSLALQSVQVIGGGPQMSPVQHSAVGRAQAQLSGQTDNRGLSTPSTAHAGDPHPMSALPTRVLAVIPPMTQLNTPYPPRPI
jgi:hypothetical protein